MKKQKNKNAKERTDQRGIALFMVIVIIASVSLLLGLNASLLGVSDLDSSFSEGKGNVAYVIAEGCLEDTLRHIRLNSLYGVGGPNIQYNVEEGSCIIQVTASGNARTVTVSGSTNDGYYKVLRAVVVLSGNGPLNIITLNSWVERNDAL